MSERTLLVSMLEKTLLPVLLREGFEQRQFPGAGGSPELKRAFPFGQMRRASGRNHDLVEIQLDKDGAPKFVLNVGTASPEGVELPWVKLSQDEVTASAVPDAYRLYSGSFMQWFSPGVLPKPWISPDERTRSAVDLSVELFPEVVEWFRSRAVGRHMRRLG